MSRTYDSGKYSYAKDHRIPNSGQETRHLIANQTLELYGVKVDNYSEHAAELNYRMGSKTSNTIDRLIDNEFHRAVFDGTSRSSNYDYDAYYLANNKGVSYQQQIDRFKDRFDTAKEMYDRTGEYKYYMMQKDIRDIVDNKLDVDLRGFRLSSRK
eukprot:gene16369-18564_t